MDKTQQGARQTASGSKSISTTATTTNIHGGTIDQDHNEWRNDSKESEGGECEESGEIKEGKSGGGESTNILAATAHSGGQVTTSDDEEVWWGEGFHKWLKEKGEYEEARKPMKLKNHLVMEHTAQCVRTEGDSFEFRLKLLPADSCVDSGEISGELGPFSFLDPEHSLHPYYLYLKQTGDCLYYTHALPPSVHDLYKQIYPPPAIDINDNKPSKAAKKAAKKAARKLAAVEGEGGRELQERSGGGIDSEAKEETECESTEHVKGEGEGGTSCVSAVESMFAEYMDDDEEEEKDAGGAEQVGKERTSVATVGDVPFSAASGGGGGILSANNTAGDDEARRRSQHELFGDPSSSSVPLGSGGVVAAALPVCGAAKEEGVVFVDFGSKKEEEWSVDPICWKPPTVELGLTELSSRVIQEAAVILLCLPKDHAQFCAEYKDEENTQLEFLRSSTVAYRYFRYVMHNVVKQMNQPDFAAPPLFTHTPHHLTTTLIGKVQHLVEQRNQVLQASLLVELKKQRLVSLLPPANSEPVYVKEETQKDVEEEDNKETKVLEKRRKKARELLLRMKAK
eukprot:GHVS01080642.1.p1 GENE.GHVS01080642.1~~GHVS01080642.1.p1  ORF type:complete len:568 (-),score=167.41 GHVS01080642.1:276-1979(-)